MMEKDVGHGKRESVRLNGIDCCVYNYGALSKTMDDVCQCFHSLDFNSMPKPKTPIRYQLKMSKIFEKSFKSSDHI